MAVDTVEKSEPKAAGSAGFRLHDQMGHLLRQVYQKARKKMVARLDPFDLTPMQSAALTSLWEAGPTSQNELGRRIGMEASNVPGLIARLRKKGLVRLERDVNNKRQYVLSLTPAGTDAVEKIIPLGERANEEMLANLSPEERKIFVRLLKKILD